MAEPVQGIQIQIDEPDDSVRVDPVSGTVERDQPDGGVVVQLDAHRPKADDGEDKFYANLALDMDGQRLAEIANELYEQIEADDRSRGNYLEIRARGLDLLGLELKEPRANVGDTSASVEGMSSVTNPLLLEAILKGWANAEAELLPSDGPVKVADKSDEPNQAQEELADSLERDMNHYLTDIATEYYPDTSHMLLWGTYFGGSGFKKVYRCPMRRRPVSESVDVKDLIVSDTTKDLRSCGRVTHQIMMRPSVMKRMLRLGAYRGANDPLPPPTAPQIDATTAKIATIQGTDPSNKRPEDQPYTIWETQCELDLPEFAPAQFKDDGIQLPFLVTMDKDTRQILAIRRDWNEDDDQSERERMYVKYPYVPGPGFYGTGMLNILGNASAALTAAWREALDAGMFANFPSFLIAKLAGRQNTSDLRVGPGTGVPIDTAGGDIRTVATPMPYKDVTPGLLALIDKITQQASSLGASAEIPTSEGVANVPVGTMLAQIEQATKVIAAAHKGMYRAQAEEIQLIVKLFRRNPEDFWKFNKTCPKNYWNEQKFIAALNDCDLVPAADPNTPSHIHRVAKALALVQLTMNPVIAPRLNIDGILQRALRAMKEDPNGIILPPAAPAPPQPDPNLIKAQAALTSAQAQQTKAQVAAASTATDAQVKAAELSTERDIATTNLAKEMVIHRDDAAQQASEHGLNTAKAVHQAGLATAQHALDVHQALNPTSPQEPAP